MVKFFQDMKALLRNIEDNNGIVSKDSHFFRRLLQIIEEDTRSVTNGKIDLGPYHAVLMLWKSKHPEPNGEADFDNLELVMAAQHEAVNAALPAAMLAGNKEYGKCSVCTKKHPYPPAVHCPVKCHHCGERGHKRPRCTKAKEERTDNRDRQSKERQASKEKKSPKDCFFYNKGSCRRQNCRFKHSGPKSEPTTAQLVTVMLAQQQENRERLR